MCKLADFGHRFTKVSDSDKAYLEKLIQVEESREQFNKKDSVERGELLAILEHKDEDKLMTTSVSNLNNHLVTLKDELGTAEEEEENARKV